jgi:hypothetical protein
MVTSTDALQPRFGYVHVAVTYAVASVLTALIVYFAPRPFGHPV